MVNVQFVALKLYRAYKAKHRMPTPKGACLSEELLCRICFLYWTELTNKSIRLHYVRSEEGPNITFSAAYKASSLLLATGKQCFQATEYTRIHIGCCTCEQFTTHIAFCGRGLIALIYFKTTSLSVFYAQILVQKNTPLAVRLARQLTTLKFLIQCDSLRKFIHYESSYKLNL